MARPLNCRNCRKPKTQCKCGQPTKMTEETIHRLREAYSMDCTDEEACCYAKISTATLYAYQKKNTSFSEEKQLLKQKPYLIARKSVITGVKADPRLALDYMKLKKSNEFKTKTDQGVTDTEGKDVDLGAVLDAAFRKTYGK